MNLIYAMSFVATGSQPLQTQGQTGDIGGKNYVFTFTCSLQCWANSWVLCIIQKYQWKKTITDQQFKMSGLK